MLFQQHPKHLQLHKYQGHLLLFQDGGGCVAEHAGEVLALAHFLDETWAQRPARRIEASPWYEAANALASRLLGQHTRSAPKVPLLLSSLSPIALFTSWLKSSRIMVTGKVVVPVISVALSILMSAFLPFSRKQGSLSNVTYRKASCHAQSAM